MLRQFQMRGLTLVAGWTFFLLTATYPALADIYVTAELECNGGKEMVRVTWESNPLITGDYLLDRETTGSVTPLILYWSTATSYLDQSPPIQTTYWYHVEERESGGMGSAQYGDDYGPYLYGNECDTALREWGGLGGEVALTTGVSAQMGHTAVRQKDPPGEDGAIPYLAYIRKHDHIIAGTYFLRRLRPF